MPYNCIINTATRYFCLFCGGPFVCANREHTYRLIKDFTVGGFKVMWVDDDAVVGTFSLCLYYRFADDDVGCSNINSFDFFIINIFRRMNGGR